MIMSSSPWSLLHKRANMKKEQLKSHFIGWKRPLYQLWPKPLQCDHIGQFSKVIDNNFLSKVAKCMVTFWAKVKKNSFNFKQLWPIFGQLLEKIGLIFVSACGHTIRQFKKYFCVWLKNPKHTIYAFFQFVLKL